MAPLSARVYLGAYNRLTDPENEDLLPLLAEFKKWPIIVRLFIDTNTITRPNLFIVLPNTRRRYYSADFAGLSSRQRLSRIHGSMRDGRSPVKLSLPTTTKKPLKRRRIAP